MTSAEASGRSSARKRTVMDSICDGARDAIRSPRWRPQFITSKGPARALPSGGETARPSTEPLRQPFGCQPSPFWQWRFPPVSPPALFAPYFVRRFACHQVCKIPCSLCHPTPNNKLAFYSLALTLRPHANAATAATTLPIGHGTPLPPSLVACVPQTEKLVLNFVLSYLEAEALPAQLLVNGGYVRDLLLGKTPDDLDLSLDLHTCPPHVTIDSLLTDLVEFARKRPDLNVSSVNVTTILSRYEQG